MATKVCIAGVDTARLPKLTSKDMDDLMKKVKEGDARARSHFVVANLRLVLSVVHRFGGRGDKADDMFQVGCVGLMKAIDNFDSSLNVKFSTYAVPMIIGEIRRYLRDNNSMRVSRSLRDIAYKALQAKEELSKNSFEEPSIEEIARFIDIPQKNVTFALDAISDTVSLSDPVYTDGSDTIHILDQIADTKNTDENIFENLSIKDALKSLSGREREILMMRYYVGKTQTEVSQEIGISQAQVSRLEKNALKVIKEFLV
ncbi:MAG: RNA polymerase sporulation sigma factor SigG [Clostridia bacterium]|nr:RNA polymerase sporulation sigma factor SigG [Clostridia bacterium]